MSIKQLQREIKQLQAEGKLPKYLPKNGGYYLLGVGRDAKTRKGEKQGYYTGIVYLSPADKLSRLLLQWDNADDEQPRWSAEYRSGTTARTLFKANLCPRASAGCKMACLDTAGHGGFSPSVPVGRARKTVLWLGYREGFIALLRHDVAKLQRNAKRKGFKPQVRLNGTSDIRWERYSGILSIMLDYPGVDFYDYTKYSTRQRTNLPDNYKLTYSLSEKATSWKEAIDYLTIQRPVAVVFKSKADVRTVLARGTWRGIPVVDGDEHDARFYDGAVICALAPKGKARTGVGGNFLQSA